MDDHTFIHKNGGIKAKRRDYYSKNLSILNKSKYSD